MITVQVFGATRVAVDGQPRSLGGVKTRQILEILAAHVGQPVAKDRLADLLWDGRPPRSAIGSLESYVCNLRRALQVGGGRGSALRTTTGGYLLDAEQVEVDLDQFRALVEDARSDERHATTAVQAALRLATGELLASEQTLLWAEEARADFDRLLTGACSTAAGAAMAAGDASAALSLYERLLTHDGLLEAAWTGRIRALAALGRRVEALRCYDELRRTLSRELGITPSRDAQRLHLSLLEGDARPSSQPRMDRSELRTLLTLLRDALEPMSALLPPDKARALCEIAAEALSAAPHPAGRERVVAAVA